MIHDELNHNVPSSDGENMASNMDETTGELSSSASDNHPSKPQPVTNRTQVRQLAVQALYQMMYNEPRPSLDEAVQFAVESGHFPDEGFKKVSGSLRKFLVELIEGVLDHQAELDAQIEPYLKDWTIERIAKIDLVILRLATFELNYLEDVPAKVAVDEAVELTKFFSVEKSRLFINGVLHTMLENIDK